MREKLKPLVESKVFERFILIVIVINAIDLGLETWPQVMAEYGSILQIANLIFISIYVIEMILKLIVYRGAYFRDGWNIFDFCIVITSLVPTGGIFSGVRILRIFRILRALRVLRLVSGIKKLRQIVMAIIKSLPGVGWTFLLMILLYYVFAIVGIELFAHSFPDNFGDMFIAFKTLFELTTLEGWQDIVFPITDANPTAWIYFLIFIVFSSFILLNVVIGIVIDTMDEMSQQDTEAERIEAVREAKAAATLAGISDEEYAQQQKLSLEDEIAALRRQMDKVQGMIEDAVR